MAPLRPRGRQVLGQDRQQVLILSIPLERARAKLEEVVPVLCVLELAHVGRKKGHVNL